MGIFDIVTGDRPPLVSRAFEDISLMLRTGGSMLAAATGHLLDNEILDVDLDALDATINEREIDLRRVLLEHLSINPRKDLVFSLKLLSVVQEAERIGDLAKSLAEISTLATSPRMGENVQELRQERDIIIRLLGQVHEALVEDDEETAVRLMSEQEKIKQRLNSYIARLASSPDLSAENAIVLALTARMLSRISSHLANIASTVASPFDQIRGTPLPGSTTGRNH